MKFADSNGIGPNLVDVQWEGTNLTVVDWSQFRMLGDEHTARQRRDACGKKKGHWMRQQEYQDASRANHQLAVALQNQGLTEDAARFAYRARCLKRKALWYRLLLTQQARRVLPRISSS